MDLKGVQVTWLGHGTFKMRAPNGTTLLIDPWVQNNPACPEDQKNVGKLTGMLITHGHFDHIADAVTVAEASQPDQVVCIFEIGNWLEKKGVKNLVPMNKGGTIEVGGVQVTMVHADHSCGILDGEQIIYGGEAVGYVLTFPGGPTLYVAGDTAVFSDMRIIHDLYNPSIAILPIGDFYTMGPREAAYAAGLLGVQGIIPAHFGTFPALAGNPAALREALSARGMAHVEVAQLQPGQSLN